jgi:hypothetical protein
MMNEEEKISHYFSLSMNYILSDLKIDNKSYYKVNSFFGEIIDWKNSY